LEATPKIAEKIAVAQTLGTLSLSLRSLADSQSELDRAVAQGNFKISDGLTKEAETKLIATATTHGQDRGSTFTTGGDVSRFHRSSGAPKTAGGRPAPTVPTVRVFRGEGVTIQPIGGSVKGMVNQQATGIGRAGSTMSGATAASMIAG
jgi:pilus assembly protein CpaB